MGNAAPDRRVPAWRTRHARPAADSRETVRARTRDRDACSPLSTASSPSGTPELVLVSGYSGIGKSSVVNELHKALVPPRGLFASGKFDQYKRDIPYSTLAQAFQSLVRPLLARATPNWRSGATRCWRRWARTGALMVDLVPELKLIIGEQPPVPELPPKMREAVFSWCSVASSACSRGRNIRWRSSSTICNGSTRRRSICSRIC